MSNMLENFKNCFKRFDFCGASNATCLDFFLPVIIPCLIVSHDKYNYCN